MTNRKTFRIAALLMATLVARCAAVQQLHNGEDILRAMHDRYAASWYQTVTFTQKSTTYNPDGTTKAETWHEAASVPGKLRIDMGQLASNNGVVLVDGTATILKDGKVTKSLPLVNMLLVLGFDVYRQDPQKTAEVVKSQSYDLTKLREDTWQGAPVYVVGADKGDLNSRQFWVEKDTLLFVREIEPSREDPKKMDDIRFLDYRKLQGGMIAARVEVYAEGKMTFSEEYSDIEGNVRLSPSVFDPAQFASTHWEKE